MVAPCSICFTINKDRLPAFFAESRSVIFCNRINAFKKKIFVNFVSFLLTLECGYGNINGV